MQQQVSDISFKTTFYIGEKSLDRLDVYEKERIMVVTDSFFEASPLLQTILSKLSNKNEVLVFSEVVPDPPIEVVSAGVQVFKEFAGSKILAVGGGSPIDAAKGIKFILQQLDLAQEVGLTIIPTTSGSGSEATNFSIITDKLTGIKYPLVVESIQPDEAILNTDFVMTMPPTVTADTGMDVLTHILEAYVSVKSNDFTDALCEKAIALLFVNLPIAFKDGSDRLAREKVHHAATLAGMAFNVTSLGINHSLAHAAGATYEIAHGRLNTILMPHIIRFNAGLDPELKFQQDICERYALLAKSIGVTGANNRLIVINFLNRIDHLRRVLEVPRTLTECQISRALLEETKKEIADNALKDACTQTNPKQPSRDDLEKILEKSF